MTLIFGLLGLSLVVVIHELGHFFAARSAGVGVDAFSIGWGPRLASFTRGGVEWRISAFPLGGYCKLKGEDSFRIALERKLETIPAEAGSYYGASPWRRIAIGAAGPASNAVFAVVLFALAAGFGTTIVTPSNRIILASGYPALSSTAQPNPADAAGLVTGDRILSIGGKPVRDYSDLQQLIGIAPGKPLAISVDRDGRPLELTVTPRLDTSTGAGLIGVYAWTDPLVGSVAPGSAADIAGLLPGDRIASVEGKPVENTIDFFSALAGKPEILELEARRNGQAVPLKLVLTWGKTGESDSGIGFAMMRRTVRADSLAQAVSMGFADTKDTLSLTLKGFGLLFSGVDVMKAVSGPARITWMVGKTASDGFKAEGAAGLVPVLKFLGFLSVGLFVMNLLPIPALDGGQILLFFAEWIKRRPLKVKTIYRFQYVGAAMIAALLLLSTFSDILFFTGK